MAIEAPRGCGFRKVGGLYLVGADTLKLPCDRLPFELKRCHVCGGGIKFTRGFTWIDWFKYADVHVDCRDQFYCAVCNPLATKQPYGLLWVGERFYTPTEFVKEAVQMGVSRRIAAFPKNLKLNHTWVLFAHISACGTRMNEESGKQEGVPGVFYGFKPVRVEKLIWERDATEDTLRRLEEAGITPVVIPDGDKDHDPATPLVPDKSVREEAHNSVFFNDLKARLMKRKA